MKYRRVPVLALACVLAACASPRPHHMRDPGLSFHPPVEILQAYDTNHDGVLTRAELEAGLKADFAKADTNHDGVLDEQETRAVNHERWEKGLSTTSTLVDWNHDGHVDFTEFAGTARSLFDQLDVNEDGKLEPKEWQLPKPSRKDRDDSAADADEDHE